MFDLSSHFLLPLLFLTGLAAGTVDAIAGGGGLISVPVLLSLGIPPHIALGTNKLQSNIGTLMAARRYYREGWFTIKSILLCVVFVAIGAATGAIVSQLISCAVLKILIPILLFFILIYVLISPKIGHQDHPARCNEKVFFIVAGLGLGFYDGFFGPGVGSFWVFLITFFLGFNLLKATAYTKAFNLTSNVVALICFAVGMHINYHIGISMAVGQLIGGQLGAHLAIKNGAKLIRPIFLIVVSLTIMSLIHKMV